jgi:hypothetical protein
LSIAEGCDCDIADAPMRMWRRADGQVFSLASVDLGSRGFLGSSPLTLKHQCQVYANSTRHQSFSEYANYEWIHSTYYFPGNNTVYALTHMEWDCKSASTCPYYGYGYSFFSGVTLMVSGDGGDSWSHALPPPAHIVAVSPVKWNETLGAAHQAFGFRSPSSILAGRGAQAGWYYATVTAGWGQGSFQGQTQGACMMRTRDVTDPGSWLAWDGSGYSVSLSISPFSPQATSPPPPPCVPFTNSTYASLLWSTHYSAYMYFGTAGGGNDHAGWQFQLSQDLITWGPATLVAPGGFIEPGGDPSVTPNPGAAFSGRFVQRLHHPGDSRVWWENEGASERRAVGSCMPCPGVYACGSNLTLIPDAEFDALVEKPAYGCGWQFNVSGTSDYYYPTLVDPASTEANFDTVGDSATLFLVANQCVGVDGSGGCTPFDDNGLLVRNLVQVPIQFS